MSRRIALPFLALVAFAAATAFVARAQGQGGKHVEFLRVELVSTFQPSPQNTAQLVRGLLVMSDGDVRTQDFRLPVEVPVGATILEVGVVGATSNRGAVKIERLDYTNVFSKGGTSPEPAGSWSAVEIVGSTLVRKVEKPVSDDEKQPAPPTREKGEQEILVVATMARDPNLSPESRRASAPNQRDRIQAIWIKYER